MLTVFNFMRMREEFFDLNTDAAILGATMHYYVASSLLVAKYYSLEIDEHAGCIHKIGPQASFDRMLSMTNERSNQLLSLTSSATVSFAPITINELSMTKTTIE